MRYERREINEDLLDESSADLSPVEEGGLPSLSRMELVKT